MSRASASAKLRKDLYTTKQVAEILRIRDPRRIKNYSDIEDYGIRPLHVGGSGQGSRKLYSHKDLFRITLAERLSQCGFTPAAIGRAIEEIRASEWDLENEDTPLENPVLVNLAGKWGVTTRGEFRKLKADEEIYGAFVMNFQEIVGDVTHRWIEWENREPEKAE